MCGICGFINFGGEPVNNDILTKMSHSLSHRGPDDSGIYSYKNAGVAHKRLSIIGMESGRQPLSNEDQSIYLVFNGEIYNYRKLSKELSDKGHTIKTDCDSEVIIHLYEEYGLEFPSRLEGMFSIAILDQKQKKVILVRDRLGQKPLCYSRTKNHFIFASELQAINSHPEHSREIDQQSLHDYLTYMYVPAPKTIYKSTKKLLPGHILEINMDGSRESVKKFWQTDFSKKINISYQDARMELRKILIEAVQKRLMSEVPLGTFLSGGVDSTIVTGIITKILGLPVKSFTIKLGDRKYDESNYASIASNFLGSDHYQQMVNPDCFDKLNTLAKNFGEPYADSSMIPTYLLSKFASEKVKVALGGDGADELFYGYYRYLVFKYSTMFDKMPTPIQTLLLNVLKVLSASSSSERSFSGKCFRVKEMLKKQNLHRYMGIISRTCEQEKLSIYGNEINKQSLKDSIEYFQETVDIFSPSVDKELLMELDMNSYLPNDILPKVDICSMSNSLEVRSPYLDHDLVEFVNSLPVSFKNIHFKRKRILIDTFSDLLPAELLKRNKIGFGVPVSSWIRKEWRQTIEDRVINGQSVKNGIFSKPELNNIFNQHLNNKRDKSYLIWSLLMFELWYENNY